MAKILRGKAKGTVVKIIQFCNDWMSCDDGKIHGVTSLEYTDDEIKRIKKETNTGFLFERFVLKGNRLKRKQL